jgi:hypothetical protein
MAPRGGLARQQRHNTVQQQRTSVSSRLARVSSRRVIMVRMGRVGRTFRFQRHVLYHSTAKTNAGWWSATYWFSISRQSHGNAQEAQKNKNMHMNQVQSVPCFCPIKELYLSHHQANDLLNLFTKTPGAWQSDSVLDLDPGADISVRPG